MGFGFFGEVYAGFDRRRPPLSQIASLLHINSFGAPKGRVSESCKRAIRGGYAAKTPQQPEEWELQRKTAEGRAQTPGGGKSKWGGYIQRKRGRQASRFSHGTPPSPSQWGTRLLPCSFVPHAVRSN